VKVPRRGAARVRAAVVCLILLPCAAAMAGAPAAALGPSLYVDVQPAHGTGVPSQSADGQANFTVTIDLLSDPIGQAQLVGTVTDALNWPISPATWQVRVTTGGRYNFTFTVSVPNHVVADTSDSIDVEVAYKTGGVTVQSVGQTVSAAAGEFRAGSLKRVTPPELMAVGKPYLIEFEVHNEGNAGAVYTFEWMDLDLISRLKADFQLPAGLSLVGFQNATEQLRVTPRSTTPAGTYQLPARMTVADGLGNVYQRINFTVEMQFDNLPIYPGVFPRIDLTRASAALGWFLLVFSLWFGYQILRAGISARKIDAAGGSRLLASLRERLPRTLVGRTVKGVRGVFARRGRRTRRAREAPAETAVRPGRAARSRSLFEED
jgi:hypothetical protein